MADTSTTSWKLLYEAGRQALQSRKLQEAEQSFSAALQQAEDFPPGDPRLAATLNALARIYSLQRRFLAAAALLNRLLEVTERTLGPSHIQVAGVLTNLAEMYTHLGAAREELELRERVLAIRRDDPNADVASLQRLEERVTELRAAIDAQEAHDDVADDEFESLPVVRTAEYSAPIQTVDERVSPDIREPTPSEPVVASHSDAAYRISPATSSLSVAPWPGTAATGTTPSEVRQVSAPAVAEKPAEPKALLALPPVHRVTPPVMPSLAVAVADHGFADMGRDEFRAPTARRIGARSSLVSIAAGVVLVAGLLAARDFVAGSDDEPESASGSVNLVNVATVPAVAPPTPLAPEPRTVERLVAERRNETKRTLDEHSAPEATPYSARERETAEPRLPGRLPSGPALERALRSVDGAVKVIDQRTRAATDSATAIRVQAPTFNKVRMADAVGSRPPDR